MVLGAQGRTNVLYGLIGKTAERLIHEGPCPVLAVPGSRQDAVEMPPTDRPALIRHILAPLDFSTPSLDAVEYAVHLAKGVGATVTLMHVLEPASYDLDCGLGVIEEESSKRDYWNRQLIDLRDVVTAFDLQADVALCGGVPSDAILASALRQHADLIVMGTHGRRGISPDRCGSVAEAVLRRATCPVLTVKQENSIQAIAGWCRMRWSDMSQRRGRMNSRNICMTAVDLSRLRDVLRGPHERRA